jgi:hypothetical protein
MNYKQPCSRSTTSICGFCLERRPFRPLVGNGVVATQPPEVHADVAGVAKGKGLEVVATFLEGALQGGTKTRRAGPCLREGQRPLVSEIQRDSIRSFNRRIVLRRFTNIGIAFALTAPALLAQSGDISGSTSNLVTLGTTILKVLVALAGMGFVGLIIWGGLTLATNRPRGLAMIGGGLVGALLAGLAFALVNTLTGQSVSLS